MKDRFLIGFTVGLTIGLICLLVQVEWWVIIPSLFFVLGGMIFQLLNEKKKVEDNAS